MVLHLFASKTFFSFHLTFPTLLLVVATFLPSLPSLLLSFFSLAFSSFIPFPSIFSPFYIPPTSSITTYTLTLSLFPPFFTFRLISFPVSSFVIFFFTSCMTLLLFQLPQSIPDLFSAPPFSFSTAPHRRLSTFPIPSFLIWTYSLFILSALVTSSFLFFFPPLFDPSLWFNPSVHLQLFHSFPSISLCSPIASISLSNYGSISSSCIIIPIFFYPPYPPSLSSHWFFLFLLPFFFFTASLFKVCTLMCHSWSNSPSFFLFSPCSCFYIHVPSASFLMYTSTL